MLKRSQEKPEKDFNKKGGGGSTAALRFKEKNMDIQYLHDLVWRRFVRMPYGHVLDYADEKGRVFIPTAEECDKAVPNPLGWWTPIENGAFFTGVYLYSLIEAYEKSKDEKTRGEIDILVNGMFLLQDVGSVEGFIARGVADDGKSHYPFSSEDQFGPFVLALYRYYKSELCKNKDEVKERLLRALVAVKNNGWNIPCDVEGLYFCSWGNSSAWRGVCKLLFCARVIYELTGDEEDLRYYRTLGAERPADGIFSRLEIASHGYSHDLVAFLGAKQNWICACAHLSLRELSRLDGEGSQYYKAGLKNNGITAVGIVDDIKKYDNSKEGFDIDWRRINHLWEDYENNVSKGISVAYRESTFWHGEVVPHRKIEHGVLGNALFSALIAVTCGDKAIADSSLARLIKHCDHVDWENLHQSYAFVAESAMILGGL